ncbi:ATP-dependent zinc metalloprotease FtsH [Clostridium massiliamazoniense]|uniref:ATP-dependent zinc metalloprotease FtsH n=1 Tax=Clostridium massiliamazoniense TaxID=1347366 RepID=UPI0006D79548|nr:ATP-dependent zinc metalloprotease FtsH [Clostridium massiliamazoniense]
MKKMSSATTWIILFAIIICGSYFFYSNNTTGNAVSYTTFKQMWANNEIQSMNVRDGIVQIKAKDNKQYETYVPETTFNALMQENKNEGTTITFKPPSNNSSWFQIIITVLMMGVGISVLFMLMQQSQGGNKGAMNFGQSRAKMASPDRKKVTFKDVAGAKEEKEELEEIVDFLREPKRYIDMGARIPKGVLLVGPPGTGKTLLAKAVAGEAGVPFFTISGSDFVEMFVGVGASRVRSMFEQAKKNAPCIVFIDEIDAVGRQRGAGVGGGHDEREQTLNQLLVEMDGFGVNEGIIMIAATNRPDILDSALLRPGRFDRQILVAAPDVAGREEVLKVHVRNKKLAEEIDLAVLAKRTPGFTGADLENLTNEAALLAVRGNKKEIDMEDMEEAITRVIAGPEKKSKVISEHDKKLTAYHEAGHAVVMRLLPNADPVHEISIIPRGMAGGYTMNLPTEDRSYTSKSKLKDDMVGLLGGRIAEQLVMGDISTGAKNDIDRVSSIARAMVMQYGMSEKIGTISFGENNGEVFLGREISKGRNVSEEISAEIDKEVKSLVSEAYERAESLLKANMSKLDAVAQVLIEKEKIDGEEFENIFVAS